MAKAFPPPTMRAWQYSSTNGGLEKNLRINPSATLPKPTSSQHLIQVIAVALNPADYKLPELPLVDRLFVPKPATPGLDFAGCIVTPATGSSLKPGELVFGVSKTFPLSGGALAEFIVTPSDTVAAVPDAIDPIDAATVWVAGMTAYQTIITRVNKGDSIFINGGSGGTGAFGIQFAKIMGCHVTTSCSTRNIEFCKGLGADEVLDYTKGSVLESLKSSGRKYDHVVDNAGSDELLWHCHEFMQPGAVFVKVGGDPSLSSMIDGLKRKIWPGALGGMKGKSEGFFPKPNVEHLNQIATWMKEGKVKAVIDHKFPFEEAVEAFEKLKTGRARGKIVVDVASETYKQAWEKPV